MKNHTHMRRGFTLIELLVVIGILAGLLLSVLGGVKKKARKMKSISNQKQIGAGCFEYLGDHDGWFPTVDGPASVGGKTGSAIGEKGPLPTLATRLYGATTPESERPFKLQTASRSTFIIGQRDWRRYTDGLIDEVRLYSRALSAVEGKARYDKDAATLANPGTIGK